MNSWESALQAVFPKYNNLKRSFELGPTIRPVILPRKPRFTVGLQEMWYDEEESTYYQSANPDQVSLDDRVEWTTSELAKWPNVTRMAWDMWQFKHKRDAEKFIVLYNLKWL